MVSAFSLNYEKIVKWVGISILSRDIGILRDVDCLVVDEDLTTTAFLQLWSDLLVENLRNRVDLALLQVEHMKHDCTGH